MTATYTLKVVTDFAASHILEGHPGKCSRLHGHNWKVEAEVAATALNDIGMAIDFADLKAALHELVDGMDHRHLNDLPAFEGVNPTAEHVAGVVYRGLVERLSGPALRVVAVTIWETDRASVRYTED
ncbi:6-carboxytetrahydropterin synthase QueD [Ectothiorhodospiraceae bacterium WFHF3C12]|nr:6-carboxytetrahydropterin synthase QueD [Ectothiorhodospiraceae bacterium WFHF3C12]